MPQPLYYTAEIVRKLPDDGNKYETVHGELLVSPKPRPWHEIVVSRLFLEVAGYLQRYPVGVSLTLGDISWSPDTLVSPDIFVVEIEQARTLQWAEMRSLLLAVEVLSPSTANHDRFTKRRLYQEVGIPVYWIVDADTRTVEVWTPGASFPAVEQAVIRWHPAGAAEPLVVGMEELFRPV